MYLGLLYLKMTFIFIMWWDIDFVSNFIELNVQFTMKI